MPVSRTILSECAPVALALSRRATARRRLRRALQASGLTALEFAEAIGVTGRTIDWHLSGARRMSRERERWYLQRLQAVRHLGGGYVQITVQIRPTKKRADFRRARAG